jgi:N-acetylglucosamine-6-phosphate deacetylase
MKIIDVHTHGLGGYDTRTTTVEDILKVAKLHGRSGVSGIVLTLFPDSIQVMRQQMMTIKRAMERLHSDDIFPRPDETENPEYRGEKETALQTDNSLSAAIVGLHLEGPFLNPSMCGALDSSVFAECTEYSLEKLIEGFEDIVRIITIAPELDGALKLIRSISDRGIIASMGHSDATFTEAEAGHRAGALGITHIFNAMRGIHHREPAITGFGLLNRDIYVDVIADPHHLHHETLSMIFKMKPPDRIIIVSDTVKESGISSDMEGIRNAGKKLTGGSATIKEAAGRLIETGLNKELIMRCISTNPEQYLS